MAKQIQIRRDTAANWTAANPVLAQGEIGIELDGLGTPLVLQKIGDGVTVWNSLPYQESGGGVETVSGDGVDNTDPENPVLSFPNPSDIGLGNVDNTSDADKPISDATQTALNDKASNTDLDNHVNDTNNPHSTTADQVGLGNVDNTSDADKPISNATQTALNDLQQEIPNPNNLVNQFTTDTQGVSGRFTVQAPLDSNTSDAASVGYVLDKVNNVSIPVSTDSVLGGIYLKDDSASSTLTISTSPIV